MDTCMLDLRRCYIQKKVQGTQYFKPNSLAVKQEYYMRKVLSLALTVELTEFLCVCKKQTNR